MITIKSKIKSRINKELTATSEAGSHSSPLHARRLLHQFLAGLFLLAASSIPAGAVSRINTDLPAAQAVTNIVSSSIQPEVVELHWRKDLRSGLLDASEQFRPLLLLFTSGNCPYCVKLKEDVFPDPAVNKLLAKFTLVELDTAVNQGEAQMYGVSGVPTLLILSGDGTVREAIPGFVHATDLASVLSSVLALKQDEDKIREISGYLTALDAGSVSSNQWPGMMLALGYPDISAELRAKLLRAAPEKTGSLIPLLSYPRLSVRLGALELLEEVSGEDMGFDPWLPAIDPANQLAIARWNDWISSTNRAAVNRLFVPLTEEDVAAYLRDLVSDRPDRFARATRMLREAGPGIVGSIEAFAEAHPELNAEAKRKLRELRYTLLLPASRGVDPSAVAHRLVSGNLDTRLEAMRGLSTARMRAVPVLEDFLDDPEPLIRETAVDTLVKAGGMRVVPILERHLSKEKDRDVVFVIIRGMGTVRHSKSLSVLTGFLKSDDEDLAVAALRSISKLNSKKPAEAVGACLEDPRWRVRAAALECAATLQLNTLGNASLEKLQDPDEFVRATAAKTVARLMNKQAAPKLEEAFLKYDNLKGPIIAAYGSLNIALPDSFAAALEGKSDGVLLEVAANLESCSEYGLPLAAALAGHSNDDVACTALSLLAASTKPNPQYEAAILNVLRGTNTVRMLAILRSLRSERSGSSDAMDDAIATALTPVATDTNAATTNGLGELIAAFNTRDVSGTGATPMTIPGGAICEELRRLLAGTNAPIRFESAGALARLGDLTGLPVLTENLSEKPAEARAEVIEALESFSRRPEVVPVLTAAIRDPADSVRKRAANLLIRRPSSVGVNAVMEELTSTNAVLGAFEAFEYGLCNINERSPEARYCQPWTSRLLARTDRGDLQILGLLLLSKCWRAGDAPLVEPFLSSPDPWIRRAAYHTLARRDSPALRQHIAPLLGDTSEYVREVLPATCIAERGQWSHHFDGTNIASEYIYGRTSRARWTSVERDAIRTLTGDPVPRVRLEAYLALMANREDTDLAGLVATLDGFADPEAATGRIADFVERNYTKLGQSFAVLLPYLESSRRSDSERTRIYTHFGVNSADDAAMSYTNRPSTLAATYVAESPVAQAADATQRLQIVYFTKPGCKHCAKIERLLADLKASIPDLTIDTHDINQVASMALNEALCARFGVSDRDRLVAPAIFAGGGYLIKNEITQPRLEEVFDKSRNVPLAEWYVIRPEELVASGKAIEERYQRITVSLIAFYGLLDGVNPCAFATIIFFLSYLQLLKRSPREILQVGLAFILAVFLTYFVLGLGLSDLVGRMVFMQKAGLVFTWIMAIVLGVLIVFNIRDGILCLRGRLKDITLQLPGFLKRGIHAVIRTGARQSHFVIAAFVSGIAVSLLELACTGQGYLPAITFMHKTGTLGGTSPIAYLLLYNVAFIVPLAAIFSLHYAGMRSEHFAKVLQRHAAWIKFGTALVFAAMLALLLKQMAF